MDKAPVTPPPNVSDSEGDMETGDEDDLLAYTGTGGDGADTSSSDDNGLQHV